MLFIKINGQIDAFVVALEAFQHKNEVVIKLSVRDFFFYLSGHCGCSLSEPFIQEFQDFLFSPRRAPSPFARAVRAAKFGFDPDRFCELRFCLRLLAVPEARDTRSGLTRTPYPGLQWK